MGRSWNNSPMWARQAGNTGRDGQAGAGRGFNLNENAYNERRNAYEFIKGRVIASLRGASGDVAGRVNALARTCDTAAVAAVDGALTAMAMRPPAQRDDGTDTSNGQRAYDTSNGHNPTLYPAQATYVPPNAMTKARWAEWAQRVMVASHSMADAALAGADAEAASIVSAALLSACPKQPTNASDFDIGERRADMRAIMVNYGPARNDAALGMLRTAMADGDDTTIYTLLCAASGVFLKGLGVDVDALRRSYALAKSGVSAGAAFQPYQMSTQHVACLAFIVAQESADSSLAGMIAAARACSDGGLRDVEAEMAAGRL